MDFNQLISDLIVNTTGTPGGGFAPDGSLAAFLPELVICATIVLMLLVKVFRFGRAVDAYYFALAGSIVGLLAGLPWVHLLTAAGDPDSVWTVSRMEIFGGMLVYDTFTVYMRAVLLFFAVLFMVFTRLSGIPDREDGADIYTLVLGGTLGMCLMAESNHLLMIFLSVEMASVPSYALAGLLKGRKKSSEAALKYSVYGAGAAGVMLYGISLIAGIVNTAHLPSVAEQLAIRIGGGELGGGEYMVLALGGLMIMVGLAFKLSAVPFHFWCPDVFEGASAEVNAFLSVASKAAALALLVRVAIGFGMLAPEGFQPGERSALAAAEDEPAGGNEGESAQPPTTEENAEPSEPPADSSAGFRGGVPASFASAMVSEPRDTAKGKVAKTAGDAKRPTAGDLAPVRDFIAKLVALLAVITCTFGNLAAYGQTNIKRLLAYSTIAHAGYMMMAVPAALAMAELSPDGATKAIAALCIYIFVYIFMNLGAFAIVAFLRNAMRSEEIADYAGLINKSKGATICLSLIMFSLIGIPPLAGFIGKFAVFAALADGFVLTSAAGQPAYYLLILLVAGGINTAISLVYYLRIVKVMTIDPEPAEPRPFHFSGVSLPGMYMWLVVAGTVVFFFWWSGVNEMALAAARHLVSG